MPAFGVDISDESLKFIELKHNGSGLNVGRYGERKIPPGVIESGKIKDQARLEEILITLRKEEGIHSVRVSLPEEQVYLFTIKLGKAGLVSIREGIDLSIEEHIPIPADNAIFDYEILSEDAENYNLQVAAMEKGVIEKYLTAFANASILVQAFELEAQAVSRAVIKKGDKDTYMIVDFGGKRTGIFIISKGVVVLTSTLDIGGEMLNQTLMKSFKVSPEEAENMKREYGLQRNVQNKEVFPVLLNSVSILRDEIQKNFLYWHTHKDENGNTNPPISSIVLCGGDSNLIGLADYFSVSMKNNVQMANVWSNVYNIGSRVPEISFKQGLSFACAIGLALANYQYD